MSNTKASLLESEIAAKAKEIHADAYPMSIGELMSLYRDNELDIHPEFQRFFRWSQLQKSKFIESILLGIPVPSIFVSQRGDGVWDVVDGVQRLSTIFEFVGILTDEKGEAIPPSSLVGTDYLPSLDGKVWEDTSRPKQEFPTSLRLDFKRQKLDLKIIKKESDPNTKYDLFERLNTLGSQLSDQEVRNCLLVMINRSFFKWLQHLAKNKHFQETIGLTDTSLQQRYDMELVLRFLIFHGPAKLIVKGCRGIRVEQAGKGRSINQAATIGFSANLAYSNTRCETFASYLMGKQELFNDKFAGENGFYFYEETPHFGKKTGITGRGIEGVTDSILKIFGI